MKQRIEIVIQGNQKGITLKDFCENYPNEYTYIGRYIWNVSHIIVVGELIEKQGSYYRVIEEKYNQQKEKQKVILLELDKNYNPSEHKLLIDCSIIMNVWDSSLKKAPIFSLAFTKSEIGEAQDIIKQGEFDFDIWVDGKEIKKDEFLKL